MPRLALALLLCLVPATMVSAQPASAPSGAVWTIRPRAPLEGVTEIRLSVHLDEPSPCVGDTSGFAEAAARPFRDAGIAITENPAAPRVSVTVIDIEDSVRRGCIGGVLLQMTMRALAMLPMHQGDRPNDINDRSTPLQPALTDTIAQFHEGRAILSGRPGNFRSNVVNSVAELAGRMAKAVVDANRSSMTTPANAPATRTWAPRASTAASPLHGITSVRVALENSEQCTPDTERLRSAAVDGVESAGLSVTGSRAAPIIRVQVLGMVVVANSSCAAIIKAEVLSDGPTFVPVQREAVPADWHETLLTERRSQPRPVDIRLMELELSENFYILIAPVEDVRAEITRVVGQQAGKLAAEIRSANAAR